MHTRSRHRTVSRPAIPPMRMPRPPWGEVIGPDEDPYLLRWFLIRTPWFRLYLHRFMRSDDDRALHDHPAWNVSMLLSGCYIEHLAGGHTAIRRPWRPWEQFRLVFRRAETQHRVQLIGDRKVWTLFLRGPTVREWGFACPNGWIHWTKFVQMRPGGNSVGDGCGE